MFYIVLYFLGWESCTLWSAHTGLTSIRLNFLFPDCFYCHYYFCLRIWFCLPSLWAWFFLNFVQNIDKIPLVRCPVLVIHVSVHNSISCICHTKMFQVIYISWIPFLSLAFHRWLNECINKQLYLSWTDLFGDSWTHLFHALWNSMSVCSLC